MQSSISEINHLSPEILLIFSPQTSHLKQYKRNVDFFLIKKKLHIYVLIYIHHIVNFDY